MKTKVVNIRSPRIKYSDIIGNPDYVYIGRANKYYDLKESKWHNPFRIGIDGDREQVIKKYKEYILNKPELLDSLTELVGKTLICYCKPKPCHGDVLVKLINELMPCFGKYSNLNTDCSVCIYRHKCSEFALCCFCNKLIKKSACKNKTDDYSPLYWCDKCNDDERYLNV